MDIATIIPQSLRWGNFIVTGESGEEMMVEVVAWSHFLWCSLTRSMMVVLKGESSDGDGAGIYILQARIKEALLIERLKRYEVVKVEGPVVKPHSLTGEERFYLKKMAQKGSNYVPVGRRGIFGGVILNMHLHWKKHETVKVICKPCKPGQVHEYANEIARLSGGIPVQIIGDDTIIFYRGKDYIQPEVMSPVDTLSKKRALEKSKYEQSLESVRRFIAIAEKELELYYRHVALHGDPNNRNPISILDHPTKGGKQPIEKHVREASDIAGDDDSLHGLSETEADSTDQELSETEDDFEDNDLVAGDSIIDYEDISGTDLDSDDEDREKCFLESSTPNLNASSGRSYSDSEPSVQARA
ncbi:RNA-binding, CRM domain [Dillenia turbinata]|uniref:RNA-binding, CRM domain n=1 Tax=Dillenia turbinata TaxID=194707 RepID=A0AAN8YVR1_9MAGN